MGTKKLKKRSSAGSRFVLCPAGCGRHIPENGVNLHLDKCIQEQEEEQERASRPIQEQVAVTQDTTPEKYNDSTAKDSPDAQDDEISNSSPSVKTPSAGRDDMTSASTDKPYATHAGEVQPDEQKQVTPEATGRDSSSAGPNAFAHMMEQSKRIFSQNEKQTLKETFCLCDNEYLLLTFEGRSSQPVQERLQWSSGVNVRDRMHTATTLEAATAPRQVELAICSFIPSHTAPIRLVRQHSRLSVPVLKSILQKCIRRRRPLPAVRVAMELIDKSLGDLLRRLPVIILEDSSLHPDFGLLVWLMIAYSKDYVLPPQLVIRVLQIVFEVASCQWSDPLVQSSQEGEGDEPQYAGVSLSSFHEASESLPKSAEEMIWSILVRAEYGGMKGDIRMLHKYADLWKRRFSSGSAPDPVASQFRESNPEAAASSDVEWCSVPMLMHRRAKEQSEDRVASLCATGIDQLRMEDICIEGVDFHCSAVMDHLLSDNELVGICHDLLVLSEQRDTSQIPATAEGRRSWLEGIFKQCMWTFSSGVNRRRPLMSSTAHGKSAEKDPAAYSNMWAELLAPRVRDFQQKYVQDRLAR